MSEPVQLALIGAGRMGRMHLQALAESEVVRVSAIIDPVKHSRDAAQAIAGDVSAYAAIDDALAGEPVDAVLIAAPTPLHRSLVTDCAQRRLPILCEKPCGMTTAEIDDAATAARGAGVPLQIGYWRRFVPELLELRQQLQCGRFGELLQISCSQWDEEPPGAAFRASSGGIAIDMGVHELDQIRWLTGREIVRTGDISTAGVADGDVDCALMTYGLEGGGVGVVSLGRYFPHGDCVWVEVMGTHAHKRVEVLWGASGKTWHSALRAQAEDFAGHVRSGGPQNGASAEDARRTLELAAQAQARIGSAR